jgi:serine/threonine protein kinase
VGTASGPPVAGTVIGPYRIVRELGVGGMGVVYEAADDALDRTVALKIISPHLAGDDDFRARFTREAQALAALDSPHVVHVYAHGEVDGRLWIATQLVPDGDLGAMLQQYGAPPVRVGLDLVAQVASGLADAHEAGMVHRDIKPANVLLRRRGPAMAAYLGDFGIARHLDAEESRAGRTGTVGTPSYMAPELHTGGTAGVASDVYSLGCLAWAVLSGHAPYRGTSEYEIVSAHREQPVPQLPGHSPLVTEANRILRTAMAKDPADRYATASAVRDDLRRAVVLPDDGSTPPAPPRPRRTPPLVSAAVLLVLVVVAAVAWGVTRGEEQPTAGTSGVPSRTPSPSDAPSTDPAPGAGARERAVASLTEALTGQGPLTPEQSACAAAAWIDGAGLRQMAAEGLFDDDWGFVDVPAGELSPETRSAAATATVTCATS